MAQPGQGSPPHSLPVCRRSVGLSELVHVVAEGASEGLTHRDGTGDLGAWPREMAGCSGRGTTACGSAGCIWGWGVVGSGAALESWGRDGRRNGWDCGASAAPEGASKVPQGRPCLCLYFPADESCAAWPLHPSPLGPHVPAWLTGSQTAASESRAQNHGWWRSDAWASGSVPTPFLTRLLEREPMPGCRIPGWHLSQPTCCLCHSPLAMAGQQGGKAGTTQECYQASQSCPNPSKSPARESGL